MRALGHRASIGDCRDSDADVLVALHAFKSATAALRFRRRHPRRPLIVALTGTDLYRDLARRPRARAAVAAADLLIALQPAARRALPPAARHKLRVICQSAPAPARRPAPGRGFIVAVIGHLRAVKDPLRSAYAARPLPAASRLRIVHAGRALTPAWAARATAEMARNPRYRWLGELSPARARALLGRSHLLVLSSRMEGGANVIGEAAVRGVPVLASRIDGSLGLLGAGYRGFFPVGDTAALTQLLRRVETDAPFRASLRRHVRSLAPQFSPARERAAWRRLLAEVGRHE